jgi:hypothetical protein
MHGTVIECDHGLSIVASRKNASGFDDGRRMGDIAKS